GFGRAAWILFRCFRARHHRWLRFHPTRPRSGSRHAIGNAASEDYRASRQPPPHRRTASRKNRVCRWRPRERRTSMIWVLVAFCWIISFLFSGIEAGLLALNPVRLRHRAKSGDHGARRLQKMLKQPERLLITVLLVTNAADIIALIILTHELVIRWGWIGYPIAVAIALPVYLFLLGVLPKSLFRRFPLR